MSRSVCSLLCLLFFVLPAPGTAQEGGDDLNAKAYFQEGLRYMKMADFDSAIAEFEASIALKPFWGSLYNLGLCYQSAGETADAYRVFHLLLRKYAGALTPEVADEVGLALTEMRGAIGRLLLNVEPSGAKVRVGDKLVGESPLPDEIFVMPGSVAVKISLDGYEVFEESITIEAGTKTVLPVVLTSAAAGEEESTPAGPPMLDTSPKSETVDGIAAPVPADAVETVLPEATAPVRTKKGLLAGGIATSVLGAAGLAVGAAFNAKGVDDKATLEREALGNKDTFDTLYDDTLPTDRAMTVVGYAVGGTLLVTGVSLIVVHMLKRKSAGERVSSAVSVNFSGVSLGF